MNNIKELIIINRNSSMNYEEKIKILKSQYEKDIIKFEYKKNKINLKIVDQSNDTIKLLLKWRKKFWNYFDTKFNGNSERTRNWIQGIFKNPKRILFLIFCNGEKIGHIGFDQYKKKQKSIIIQNVILGEKEKSPSGVFKKILEKLINWMFIEFGFETIQLKVFSDNFKAINLYEKCGFLTISSEPLKREFTNDGWKWKKTSNKTYPERWFNIMEISRNNFNLRNSLK
jgi:RimJ/RimL family protein N-acetyltransferase